MNYALGGNTRNAQVAARREDGADEIRGLNKTGLIRAGFSESDIAALAAAYRKLFRRSCLFKVSITQLEAEGDLNPHVKRLIEFLRHR